MILEGNYIKIEKKDQIKPILNILYREGYYLENNPEKMFDVLFKDFTKPIFILSESKQLWWRDTKPDHTRKTKLIITSLLRKEKLKRILKTKGLLK